MKGVRRTLSLAKKIELIKKSNGKTMRALALDFNIGRKQVARILKRKQRFIQAYKSTANLKVKDSKSLECMLCRTRYIDELSLGKLFDNDGVLVHYYCVLFAEGLKEKNVGAENNFEFDVADIETVVYHSCFQSCIYCLKTGATIECCAEGCSALFHLPCGVAHQSMHKFYGGYKSYCSLHRPYQSISHVTNESVKCSCCDGMVSLTDPFVIMKSPCCENTWFHRSCIQKTARRDGWLLKCPSCCDVKIFRNEMLKYGIHIHQLSLINVIPENVNQDKAATAELSTDNVSNCSNENATTLKAAPEDSSEQPGISNGQENSDCQSSSQFIAIVSKDGSRKQVSLPDWSSLFTDNMQRNRPNLVLQVYVKDITAVLDNEFMNTETMDNEINVKNQVSESIDKNNDESSNSQVINEDENKNYKGNQLILPLKSYANESASEINLKDYEIDHDNSDSTNYESLINFSKNLLEHKNKLDIEKSEPLVELPGDMELSNNSAEVQDLETEKLSDVKDDIIDEVTINLEKEENLNYLSPQVKIEITEDESTNKEQVENKFFLPQKHSTNESTSVISTENDDIRHNIPTAVNYESLLDFSINLLKCSENKSNVENSEQFVNLPYTNLDNASNNDLNNSEDINKLLDSGRTSFRRKKSRVVSYFLPTPNLNRSASERNLTVSYDQNLRFQPNVNKHSVVDNASAIKMLNSRNVAVSEVLGSPKLESKSELLKAVGICEQEKEKSGGENSSKNDEMLNLIRSTHNYTLPEKCNKEIDSTEMVSSSSSVNSSLNEYDIISSSIDNYVDEGNSSNDETANLVIDVSELDVVKSETVKGIHFTKLKTAPQIPQLNRLETCLSSNESVAEVQLECTNNADTVNFNLMHMLMTEEQNDSKAFLKVSSNIHGESYNSNKNGSSVQNKSLENSNRNLHIIRKKKRRNQPLVKHWLIYSLDHESYDGLRWVHKFPGHFTVPWPRVARVIDNNEWHMFIDYAVLKGETRPLNDYVLKQSKRNFRCALNKSKTVSKVLEVREGSNLRIFYMNNLKEERAEMLNRKYDYSTIVPKSGYHKLGFANPSSDPGQQILKMINENCDDTNSTDNELESNE